MEPQLFYFKDDGIIPNSKYPVLYYSNVLSQSGEQAANWLEKKFAANQWTNSWRWGIYPFHHYHSNTHEVLGVFSGSALLQLGGERGMKLKVQTGDVLVIPAGVGHKCLSHSPQFAVTGAYPDGLEPDLNRGEEGERPGADESISIVPDPSADPLTGKESGVIIFWKKV
jgi:uncharacterized protein YjlB